MRDVSTRRQAALQVREEAARLAFLRTHPEHPTNGEETDYRNEHNEPSFIANYSKGLPHNQDGEVDPDAYRSLLRALDSGDPRDFEQIQLADLGKRRQRRLINPQAGLAFDLEGPDSHALQTPPPPRLDDPRSSADLAELYWMALLRDVHFADYATDPKVADAVASLSAFPAFAGPGPVTPDTLFRGPTPGDLAGPYLSQFLIKDVPYGPLRVVQRRRTARAGRDFMVEWPEWKAIQDGAQPDRELPLTSQALFIHSLRDLAYHVRVDASYQHYLNACLLLQQMDFPRYRRNRRGQPPQGEDAPPCMSGPIDVGNFYFPPGSRPAVWRVEEGFATFGNWHIQTLLAEVTTRALKAAWFQKWFVHRRLRPEAFGGLLEAIHDREKNYPLGAEILEELRNGSLGQRLRQQGFDSFLLPQAFPEGSPTHPSYPEGHATVGAACVTVLKAWFDEGYEFDPDSPNPFERPEKPNAEGTDLEPYAGRLTVGGELDKLVSNIGLGGRGAAGVHYRADHEASLQLGEAVAIGILEEQTRTYNESHSFRLTKFDGEAITIGSSVW